MSKLNELVKGMGRPSHVLHTRYGDFQLAKSADRKRLRKLVVEIQRMTDALTRKDLADWRQAWQMAINVDSPNRQRLYDIYRDVEVDLHLSGCITQRSGFVLAQSFKFVNPDDTDNEDVKKIFDQTWFKDFMRYTLESIYWGHSLIELGNRVELADGTPSFDGVTLIPRKHVIPEYHRLIRNLGEDWTTGIDYTQSPYVDWLIEAGQRDNLGLLLKAATQTIPKKNALSFWDSFAEIFGMPMRIARTASRDANERKKLEEMMESMGAMQWGVFPEGTEIDVVESTKGDAFNVYDKRIDRANSELSKLVIGQTMTIEDGSSLSQSQTHYDVFRILVEADCDMIRDVINGQLIPKMIKHGFPLHGLRFEWDYPVDYTPEQQVAFETMILNNFEVEPEYFIDKYKMPLGQRLSVMQLPAESSSDKLSHPPFFD